MTGRIRIDDGDRRRRVSALDRVEIDGRALSLRRFSASSSEWALVALHGVMSHSGWLVTLGEALAARGIGVLALDRRGSGTDPVTDDASDPEAWIADVHAALALARAEARRVALLGWCWGARLALVAAGSAKVDRVVLAAPGLILPPAVEERARAIAAAASEANDPAELPFPFAEQDFSDSPEVHAFIAGDRWRWRTQPREFARASRALLERSLAAAATLEVPSLTLLAADDRIVDSERTRARLERSHIRVIAGGHALVLERPAEVAAEIAGWLTSE
jgi:alpha-beta hydrolase superfamily lysophospholipase